MPKPVIQLIAILLVAAQGWVGGASGKIACLPVPDCHSAEAEVPPDCDHCQDVGCAFWGGEIAVTRCVDGEAESLGVAARSRDGCGCHVHVTIPRDSQSPTRPRSSGEGVRFMPAPVSLTVNAWDHIPQAEGLPSAHPPGLDACDRVLALKAIRLLI